MTANMVGIRGLWDALAVVAAVPVTPSEPVEYGELVAERDALRAEIATVKAAHRRLSEAYRAAVTELELLKRRLFVAKAERTDTGQLELDFAKKAAELDALKAALPERESSDAPQDTRRPAGRDPKAPRPPSTGRRDVRELDMPEERVLIPDPVFEALVAEGKARVSGCFEESYSLAWKRGGMRRLVVARVEYATTDRHGVREREVAPVPETLVPRSLAAPSLLAHVVTDKYCDGLPLYRIEERFGREGVPIDRGTLCRWVDAVACGLAPIARAMKEDAIRTAFCIATDATGICIQPVREPKAPRKACRKGTFFTLVADRDHVLFEFLERETSDGVCKMLKGFKGYVQADAKSVYDAFYAQRAAQDEPPLPGGTEVGCWAHTRRKFWEAAVCKDTGGLEGLFRIRRLFTLDASWHDKPPIERARLRHEHLEPELTAFFTWASAEYERLKEVRGLARSAFGYVVRQRAALSAFLADGRLKLDNNRAERALRPMRVGQKAWLFCGSDDHAASAAVHFSLVASARLHNLDPEAYLRDMIRVKPHWPEERLLELTPKYWAATRERLDPAELAAEYGALRIPERPAPVTDAVPEPAA